MTSATSHPPSGATSAGDLLHGKPVYSDAVVRAFLLATVLWSISAFLVGLFIAIELVLPALSFNLPYLAFGRLRPLHTNAAIFAFAGNAIFAAIYHSTQRLCKARLFSRTLSWLHFWGWQAIIVAAAVTLPQGLTTGRAYAEPEWLIEVAIAVVWLVFAINFFGTIAHRRERHLYISLWFYIATVVTFPILILINSATLPISLWKSYSVYAGVHDAFMQSWHSHNLMTFMLTMPLLGMMYYYLPKAAEHPVYSHWLAVAQFWSLILLSMGAGPAQLQFTALPEWISTPGVLCTWMLWMPSWAGMINGLATLRGAWDRVADDPVLKFFVVAITFYGMSTLEAPLLTIKQVDAITQYTDWQVAHTHAFAMGWVGMMTFGMLYFVMPRVFQRPLWSKTMMNVHFWLATVAILLTIVPLYIAGLTEGFMWQAIYTHGPNQGQLVYPRFVETTTAVMSMYWLRIAGGSLYLLGAVLCGVNCVITIIARRIYGDEEIPESSEANTVPEFVAPMSRLQGAIVADVAHRFDIWLQGWWHRALEARPLKFTIYILLAVVAGSAFELAPMFFVPTTGDLPPTTGYTPFELLGRDIYLANGCCNCHTQMIRPILAETKRYGEFSKPAESMFDHPVQWGSRRIGPDLAREGLDQRSGRHALHFQDPRSITPESIMPSYEWMLHTKADIDGIPRRMQAMKDMGVPYSAEEIAGSVAAAKKQAAEIAKVIERDAAISDLDDTEVVALIAYLNRLGREQFASAPAVASKAMAK